MNRQKYLTDALQISHLYRLTNKEFSKSIKTRFQQKLFSFLLSYGVCLNLLYDTPPQAIIDIVRELS